jgi:hypothetical protein
MVHCALDVETKDTLKVCKNCEHYGDSHCFHPAAVMHTCVVEGTTFYYYASTMRSEGWPCGLKANLFSERDWWATKRFIATCIATIVITAIAAWTFAKLYTAFLTRG